MINWYIYCFYFSKQEALQIYALFYGQITSAANGMLSHLGLRIWSAFLPMSLGLFSLDSNVIYLKQEVMLDCFIPGVLTVV